MIGLFFGGMKGGMPMYLQEVWYPTIDRSIATHIIIMNGGLCLSAALSPVVCIYNIFILYTHSFTYTFLHIYI